jgi:hypothetical protein
MEAAAGDREVSNPQQHADDRRGDRDLVETCSHDNGVPVRDMDCSSMCADQPTDQPEKTPPPRPFLNSLSHSGTIARQVPPCLFSSIGGPRGRRSRVGLNLSNGLRRWAILVMPIGQRRCRTIWSTLTTPCWRRCNCCDRSDRVQSVWYSVHHWRSVRVEPSTSLDEHHVVDPIGAPSCSRLAQSSTR